jgi:hypothetical protein
MIRLHRCAALSRLPLLAVLALAPSLRAQAPDAAPPAASPAPDATAIAGVRAELEAMLTTDQAHRTEVIELEKQHGRDSREVKEAWAKQTAIDTRNIARLEEIIAAHGWPGSTRFGSKASVAAFLILQHADIRYQKRYLPQARAAAAQGELRASSLALLEDRVRLREGQKQLYGSQVTRNSAGEWEPLPLEDEASVDTRRAGVGLGPLADYLQGFAARSGGRVHPQWAKAETASAPTPQPEPAPKPAAPVTAKVPSQP